MEVTSVTSAKPSAPSTYFSQIAAERVDVALCRVSTQVAKAMDAAFGDTRLSVSQHLVLGMLARVGAVSQQELSEQLRIDRSVMVGCIDGLEDAGFVRRERNPHDRRAYAVVPTGAGLAALEEADRGMADRLDRVFGALSPSERAEFGRLARKVLNV